MKIKVKLTLFYTVSSVLVILFFSFLIYYGMSFLLFNEIDRNLAGMADNLLAQQKSDFSFFASLEQSLDNLRSNAEVGVNVVDPRGKVLFKSKISKEQNINLPNLRSTKSLQFLNYKIETINENVKINDPGVRHKYYRILVRKFFYKGYFLGWIQVFQPIDKVYAYLGILKKIIFMGVPVVIIFISLVGYYLAQKSLSPIHSIASAAGKISDSNLSERIAKPRSSDELSSLINILNELFDRLEKSFNTQKQFISDAAHELKTPLAILRTNIESEINNRDMPLSLKQKLSQNIETLSRLSTLVEKLLFLSKLENKKIVLNKTSVDLSRLIENIADDISFLIENKQQTLHLDLDENIMVNGDADLLYQAFFNFINNAVKYTHKEGRIAVSSFCSGEQVSVIIEDNGIGMRKDELENIFHRFYRSDKSRTREKGYGLGLSIAKWIIALHEGRIQVESQYQKGTKITVFLPV